MKLDPDKYIQVRMTETATYSLTYTVAELAGVLGVEPTAEAVGAVLDPENGTYGLKGDKDALLTAMVGLETVATITIGARSWDFFQTLRP